MRSNRLKRRALLLVAAAVIGMAVASTSAAQIEPRLERLEVDLWPELDRLEMLVIYRGTLTGDVPLPATLTFRLPSQIEGVHAVAYSDGAGSLFDATYSTEATENGLVVNLETPAPDFQVEFYDALTRDGDQRSYDFVWPGDYAVDQLGVAFLPPPGATQIQTQPTLSPVQRNSGEFIYVGRLGSLAADQTSRVALSYSGGETGASSVSSPQNRSNGVNIPLIAAVALAILVLVIGGVLWYTRQAKPKPTSPEKQNGRPKRSRKRARRKPTDQSAPSPAAFCTQCGGPVRPDDRFCGRCGTPVKGNT